MIWLLIINAGVTAQILIIRRSAELRIVYVISRILKVEEGADGVTLTAFDLEVHTFNIQY